MPPIPEQMRALPRDPRGYPIPVTIGRDQNGKPHFVVNDEAERQRVIAHALCSICGERMSRVRWFVGGPQSAFHEHGAYIDPPMHKDCAHFALQCCPYLAMPSYRGFADTQKVADRFNNGPLMVNTMMPGRPPVFVAVRSDGVEIKSWRGSLVETLAPMRPYSRVEYWRDGQRLSKSEGRALAEAYMHEPIVMEPRSIVMPRQGR